MVYCRNCGKALSEEENTNCPHCGSPSDGKMADIISKSSNQDSPQKKGTKTSRIMSLCVVGIITTVALIWVVSFMTKPLPAQIQVVDVNFDSNQGIFVVDYYLSGRVINSGESPSNPIILQIRFTDGNGNNLLTGQTSPQPSILHPGQEAPFAKGFTNADINSYQGPMNYEITMLSG